MPPFVLDTSALLTLFGEEEGAEQVVEILGRERGDIIHEVSDSAPRPRVYLPFMALMEFEYMVLRRYGPYESERAVRLIRSWPVVLVESQPEWRGGAARLKSAGSLSLGDAWNASLALLLDAELVHKDPEFDQVEGLRSLRLPYKEKIR